MDNGEDVIDRIDSAWMAFGTVRPSQNYDHSVRAPCQVICAKLFHTTRPETSQDRGWGSSAFGSSAIEVVDTRDRLEERKVLKRISAGFFDLDRTRRFMRRHAAPAGIRLPFGPETPSLNTTYCKSKSLNTAIRCWRRDRAVQLTRKSKEGARSARLYTRVAFPEREKPVYDHFQLKDLIRTDGFGGVYCLTHFSEAGTLPQATESSAFCPGIRPTNRHPSVLSRFSLETDDYEQALGPWDFDTPPDCEEVASFRPPALTSHSPSLYAIDVSRNYLAVADSASNILIAKRTPCCETLPAVAPTLFPSRLLDERRTTCTERQSRGKGWSRSVEWALCERISSHPLQITNSLRIIEVDPLRTQAERLESICGRGLDDHLTSEVVKHACERAKRRLRLAIEALQILFIRCRKRFTLSAGLSHWKNVARVLAEPSHRFAGTPIASKLKRIPVSPFEPQVSDANMSAAYQLPSAAPGTNAPVHRARELGIELVDAVTRQHGIVARLQSERRRSVNGVIDSLLYDYDAPQSVERMSRVGHQATNSTSGGSMYDDESFASLRRRDQNSSWEKALLMNGGSYDAICGSTEPFVGQPHVTILCASNDKSISEYALGFSRVEHDTGTSGSDAGLRAASAGFTAGLRASQSLRTGYIPRLDLVRRWSLPFSANALALHPAKDLLLIVGDTPVSAHNKWLIM